MAQLYLHNYSEINNLNALHRPDNLRAFAVKRKCIFAKIPI